MPRGGVRNGAGRPKTTLAALVDSGGFNWESRLHRQLLLEGDLSSTHLNYNRLLMIQESYRRCGGVGPDAVHVAKLFASEVTPPAS